ncbi:MAG: hypothetical protein U0869_19265 [Chloroflexota bacterium]
MATKLVLLLGIIVGAAVAAYGLLIDKSGQNIAFATAGLFILGISLAISGFLLGMSAIGSGREGRGVRGLALAFLGGLFLLAAAGALAGATIFAIVVLF